MADVVPLRQQLDSRLTILRAQRTGFWYTWQLLAKAFLPRRNRWVVVPGDQIFRGASAANVQSILNNVGTMALRTLAAGLMSGLTSPDRPWFALGLGDEDLEDYGPVKIWLAEVRDRLMRIMAKSNFYLGMSVLYEDLGCYGTSAMIIYEDFKDVIRCYNPCLGEFFLSQNDRLEVDTLYREFNLTARQMAQKFGEDNLSIAASTLLKTGKGAQDQDFIVAHAIEPNDDPGGPAPNGKLPWREVYWEFGSAQNQVLQERGFHEFPAICPRWYLSGNDVYGRSPAMDALGDQRQLQVMTKRLAQAQDKMVNPPMLADNALKNEPASLLPGGVTYVPQLGQVGGMKPVYEVQPNVGVFEKTMADVEARINKALYSDLFQMISQLDTVRTATEIIERRNEKLLLLSPMLERMFAEGLDPAVRRIAKIAARAGLFPPMPKEMRGHNVEIEYTSILAQAQRSVATAGIERLAGFVGSLAGAIPGVLDKFDADEAVDQYADYLGVSPKIVRNDTQVAALRKAQADKQQQMEAMQASMAAVQGAATLSKTDVGGGINALQSMLGNQSAGAAPANAA